MNGRACAAENTAEIHGLSRRVQTLNEKIDHFKTRDLDARPDDRHHAA